MCCVVGHSSECDSLEAGRDKLLPGCGDVKINLDLVLHLDGPTRNTDGRDPKVALPQGRRSFVAALLSNDTERDGMSLTMHFQLASDGPTTSIGFLDCH